ncbi:hypothetical protein BDD12DRAFT_841004 [Trichophaea hybrida]|nr:hypothetical protein BDD12DRAFT_841004 [Trichophaea hybrida]
MVDLSLFADGWYRSPWVIFARVWWIIYRPFRVKPYEVLKTAPAQIYMAIVGRLGLWICNRKCVDISLNK